MDSESCFVAVVCLVLLAGLNLNSANANGNLWLNLRKRDCQNLRATRAARTSEKAIEDDDEQKRRDKEKRNEPKKVFAAVIFPFNTCHTFFFHHWPDSVPAIFQCVFNVGIFHSACT